MKDITPHSGPFVGRLKEQLMVVGAVDLLNQGHAVRKTAFTFVGYRGMGRTRLLHEIEEQVEDRSLLISLSPVDFQTPDAIQSTISKFDAAFRFDDQRPTRVLLVDDADLIPYAYYRSLHGLIDYCIREDFPLVTVMASTHNLRHYSGQYVGMRTITERLEPLTVSESAQQIGMANETFRELRPVTEGSPYFNRALGEELLTLLQSGDTLEDRTRITAARANSELQALVGSDDPALPILACFREFDLPLVDVMMRGIFDDQKRFDAQDVLQRTNMLHLLTQEYGNAPGAVEMDRVLRKIYVEVLRRLNPTLFAEVYSWGIAYYQNKLETEARSRRWTLRELFFQYVQAGFNEDYIVENMGLLFRRYPLDLFHKEYLRNELARDPEIPQPMVSRVIDLLL